MPAFLRAARLAIHEKQFKEALQAVNVVLDLAPGNSAARLLKGQVLIVNGEFAAAAAELEEYLQQRPDPESRMLVELCRRPRPDEPANLLSFAQVFIQQKSVELADGVLSRTGRNWAEARRDLLVIYQKRIEAAWSSLGGRLSIDSGGMYRLDLRDCRQVVLLDPLRGIPLTRLNLWGCDQVHDVTPLQGMALTRLELRHCARVRDLAPLRGMQLTYLDLNGCIAVTDLTPLSGMPLNQLNLQACAQVRDLTPLQDMPLSSLNLAQCRQVSSLSPLRGMPLVMLFIHDCDQAGDLTSLEGMNLTSVTITPRKISKGLKGSGSSWPAACARPGSPTATCSTAMCFWCQATAS